jgi:DNA-binding cell septation regulator SpoVG
MYQHMLRINVEDVGRGTKGHILASCRITLSSEDGSETITIFDARVLRNRSGELWVAFPTQSMRDFEGAQKYIPILDFSKDLRRRISDTVLAEYNGVRGAQQRMNNYGDVRPSFRGINNGR